MKSEMKRLIVLGILLFACFVVMYIASVLNGADPFWLALILLSLYVFIITAP